MNVFSDMSTELLKNYKAKKLPDNSHLASLASMPDKYINETLSQSINLSGTAAVTGANPT
jgi:hypothetical protein